MLRHVASTELYEFKSGVPLVEHLMANMKKQHYGTRDVGDFFLNLDFKSLFKC